MADEQVIVEIKVEDKEVKEASKAFDTLTNSIENTSKVIKDARDNNKKYKQTIADLDKQLDEGTVSLEDHAKQTKLLQKEIDKNNKTIAESQQELTKLKRERNANIKLIKSEADSLARLEAKATLLNQAITKQETATEKGRKEYERLNKELGETNAQINEQRQAFNDNTRNIGNYKQVLEGLNEVQPQVVGGVQNIGAAMKALAKNPIVIILAAIVGALKLLFDGFKRSENGTKLLGRAMAALKGVFGLITRAANQLAKVLVDIWDDPKKAAEDFGKTLEDNLSKRMDGLKNTFKNIGSQISAAFEGDNEKLRQAIKDTDDAFKQAATGMNKKERFKFALEMLKARKEAEGLAQAFIDLENAQRAGRGTARALEIQIAQLNKQFELQQEVIGDDTQNMQELEKATEEALKTGEALASKQVQLAKVRLNLINQEVAVRSRAGEDIQDLLDERAQAEVALIEAQSQAAISEKKILIERSKIQRDIFEQNLDILIDVGDKIKTEQEKAVNDEALSIAQRRKNLEASRVALNANFGEIKKEYELYGVTAQQINEVINASDAKQTNEKLKALNLNEIANNRLREIILERRQAELDFADLQIALDKEEADRKQKAVEVIGEIEQKRAIDSIKNQEDLRDKLIEIEEQRLKIVLSNENLLEEERQALILESEEKIQKIQKAYQDGTLSNQKETLEKRKELFEEFFAGMIEISGEFAGEQVAIFSRIAASIGEAFENGKVTAESALEGIGMASDAVFGALAARNQEQFANLEALRQRDLELAGDNEAAKQKINEKYDKAQAKLKLKQFNADKAKAITDIIIQTALAVTKSIALSPQTGGLPFSAIVAALGAAQGIVVAKQKPPKFKYGTRNIVSIGGSHESGRDVDVFGFSGGQKQYFGKVEKGEAMPVIPVNKVGYVDALLNNKFTPKRIFQQGTPDITQGGQQVQSVDSKVITSSVIEAVKNIKIVAKIEDITKEANKKIEIVEASKI